MIDPLEKAEEALDEAFVLFAQHANPDGLVQVANLWLAVWEIVEKGDKAKSSFGFSPQTDEEEDAE